MNKDDSAQLFYGDRCVASSARSAWRIAYLRRSLVSSKLRNESTMPGAMLAHQAIRDRLLDGNSMAPITQESFLALLGFYCCRPCRPVLEAASDGDDGTIFGINTLKAMLACGVDELAWVQRPVFGFFHRVLSSSSNHHHLHHSSTKGGPRDFQAVQCQAASLGEATQIIARALIAKLVRSLSGLAEEGSTPRAQSVFQAEVSTFEIPGGMGFDRVGRLVAIRSLLKKGWVGQGRRVLTVVEMTFRRRRRTGRIYLPSSAT
ncbi:uncharacterized protein BO72DRAFT_494526 [Aspergillus fijiensis CBS 313.89]|uniref:Uncharacterized protein n=1 Tax=Aspergillus fijiensis CBS 313.89 TaxID=1448319 RepID=A0A8G1RYK7_9EURO|nr:uncharacterized protein BO72DRAFT_494526 [Aspergillus fijiensis CBS 313.89]RAK79176.1 hypothetical protein BO72DRAFT_494526 [Aspergillus fijiensis CBS 313.89]